MDILLNKTIEIYEKVRLYNEILKKKKPELNMKTGKHMLSGFEWLPWEKIPDKLKSIHILRTKLLYYSNCHAPPPDKIHDFFVRSRLAAGWVLADTRKDYDTQGNWLGHDPMLKKFEDLSEAAEKWCIARNRINYKAVKKIL